MPSEIKQVTKQVSDSKKNIHQAAAQAMIGASSDANTEDYKSGFTAIQPDSKLTDASYDDLISQNKQDVIKVMEVLESYVEKSGQNISKGAADSLFSDNDFIKTATEVPLGKIAESSYEGYIADKIIEANKSAEAKTR